jgi:ubiquinone/menaquinone biosynthesis C-methylase UbiE
VTTWTLCSIPDVERAIAEMRRVLKPTGMLIFVEHGLSPDRSVRSWQDWMNPTWRALAGGCNLNRKIDALIAAAGFSFSDLERGYAEGPRPFTYMYRGHAARAATGPA